MDVDTFDEQGASVVMEGCHRSVEGLLASSVCEGADGVCGLDSAEVPRGGGISKGPLVPQPQSVAMTSDDPAAATKRMAACERGRILGRINWECVNWE
ncbi:MAG: hypothetical protein AMXMBFR6_05260 [Betaproteobacteria bacterium]